MNGLRCLTRAVCVRLSAHPRRAIRVRASSLVLVSEDKHTFAVKHTTTASATCERTAEISAASGRCRMSREHSPRSTEHATPTVRLRASVGRRARAVPRSPGARAHGLRRFGAGRTSPYRICVKHKTCASMCEGTCADNNEEQPQPQHMYTCARTPSQRRTCAAPTRRARGPSRPMRRPPSAPCSSDAEGSTRLSRAATRACRATPSAAAMLARGGSMLMRAWRMQRKRVGLRLRAGAKLATS